MEHLLLPVVGGDEYWVSWPERHVIEGFNNIMKHPRNLLGSASVSVDE